LNKSVETSAAFVTGTERTCFERQVQRSILCAIRPSATDKEISRTESVEKNYS